MKIQIVTLCNHTYSHTLLTFLVSKMNSNTLARAQLLTGPVKCKSVMFFNLWALFLKIYIFDVAFFLSSTYPVNAFFFSVVFRIYINHAFEEAFFLIETVAIMTENVLFSCFQSNHCQGNKFL